MPSPRASAGSKSIQPPSSTSRCVAPCAVGTARPSTVAQRRGHRRRVVGAEGDADHALLAGAAVLQRPVGPAPAPRARPAWAGRWRRWRRRCPWGAGGWRGCRADPWPRRGARPSARSAPARARSRRSAGSACSRSRRAARSAGRRWCRRGWARRSRRTGHRRRTPRCPGRTRPRPGRGTERSMPSSAPSWAAPVFSSAAAKTIWRMRMVSPCAGQNRRDVVNERVIR